MAFEDSFFAKGQSQRIEGAASSCPHFFTKLWTGSAGCCAAATRREKDALSLPSLLTLPSAEPFFSLAYRTRFVSKRYVKLVTSSERDGMIEITFGVRLVTDRDLGFATHGPGDGVIGFKLDRAIAVLNASGVATVVERFLVQLVAKEQPCRAYCVSSRWSLSRAALWDSQATRSK